MISPSETREMMRGDTKPEQAPETVEDKLKRAENLLNQANEILVEINDEDDSEYLVFADTYTTDDGVDQFSLTKYKRID